MSWTSWRPCTSTTLPATLTGEMICQAPSSAALRSAGSTLLSTRLSANAGPDRTTCVSRDAQTLCAVLMLPMSGVADVDSTGCQPEASTALGCWCLQPRWQAEEVPLAVS